MRSVILWRHGETEHNAAGIYQGQLDTPLSPVGWEQARVAAPVLAVRGPARLVASDLTRAAQTAGVLAELSGLRPESDARLREIHVGQWQGLSHDEVASRDADLHGALARGEDVPRGRSGERISEVAARMRQAFEAVVEEMGESDLVVLTSHGLAIRSLVSEVVGLDFHDLSRALVGLRNCHWAELVEHRTGWRLSGWNLGPTA